MTERLELFINSLGVSVNAFEVAVGASNGLIRKAIANKTEINSKSITRIADKYPQLNINWLLTGKGNMIEQAEVTPYEENSISSVLSEPGAVYESVNNNKTEPTYSDAHIDTLIKVLDKLSENEKSSNKNVAVMNENIKELIAQGREQTANITKLVNLICHNKAGDTDSLKGGQSQEGDYTQEEAHGNTATG